MSDIVYMVCGLQGTGKTTVAKKIADRINGVLLRTDVIRKEIIEKPMYTEGEKGKVYNEMFSRVKHLIEKNKNVVLDATFAKGVYRDKVRKISKGNYKIVETICPEEIVKDRISKRFEDESQAKFEHYLKYKKFFEPIKEKHIVIDTSKNIDEQIKKFL